MSYYRRNTPLKSSLLLFGSMCKYVVEIGWLTLRPSVVTLFDKLSLSTTGVTASEVICAQAWSDCLTG